MNTRTQAPKVPLAATPPVHFNAARSLHLSVPPFGTIQRKCACGGSTGADDECEGCKKKQQALQRRAISDASPGAVPAIVHGVLSSSGQPLDAASRAFFEPRFGHDFSKVRIHADERAAESAQAINALAYTVGPDVVFGVGQYQPNTSGGRQLLAHELTHVIQQQGQVSTAHELRIGPCNDAFEVEADRAARDPMPGGNTRVTLLAGSAPASVQRACGPADIGKPPGCTLIQGDVTGEHYLFKVNCDEFKPGEEARLRAFAGTMTSGGSAKIHGFASIEGDPTFNENLSCARAIKGQSVIDDVLVAAGKHVSYELFAHGATVGDRDDRRSITIDWLPAAPPSPTGPKCCAESLDVRTSGSIEGTFGISQYWPGVTPYWGDDKTLGQFDTGSGGSIGHKFQVIGKVGAGTSAAGAGGTPAFQQMARLTVGNSKATATAGAWFDDMDYVDAAGAAHHWDPNAEVGTTGSKGYPGVRRTIATDTLAYTDPPAIPYSGGTDSYRKLEFKIHFRSAPGCTCTNPEISRDLTQEIEVTKGVPKVLTWG